MKRIHPTAVVDPKAELGEDVEIGALLRGRGPRPPRRRYRPARPRHHPRRTPTLGEGNVVLSRARCSAPPPQDLKHGDAKTRLASATATRSASTSRSTPGPVKGGGLTTVGSDGLFMVGLPRRPRRARRQRRHPRQPRPPGGPRDGGRPRDHQRRRRLPPLHDDRAASRTWAGSRASRATSRPSRSPRGTRSASAARTSSACGARASPPTSSSARSARSIEIFVSDAQPARVAMARLLAEHPADPLLAEIAASVAASEAGRQGRAQEKRTVRLPAGLPGLPGGLPPTPAPPVSEEGAGVVSAAASKRGPPASP